jgi:hypothetical protein
MLSLALMVGCCIHAVLDVGSLSRKECEEVVEALANEILASQFFVLYRGQKMSKGWLRNRIRLAAESHSRVVVLESERRNELIE